MQWCRLLVTATPVLLQTVDGCHGLTSENGDAPPDLLPLAVWFEDVSDLSAGLGYASEDAYDSPIAKLAFRGARIDHSTRDELEEWRKRSAEQSIRSGVYYPARGATISQIPIRRGLANTYEFATVTGGLNCLMIFVPNCATLARGPSSILDPAERNRATHRKYHFDFDPAIRTRGWPRRPADQEWPNHQRLGPAPRQSTTN